MTAYVVAITADELGRMSPAAFAAIALVVGISLASYVTPGLGIASARRTVAMTATIRNLSLALLVAGLSADAERVAVTVIAYGTVMYAAPAMNASEFIRIPPTTSTIM